jgi:hypothetical protein
MINKFYTYSFEVKRMEWEDDSAEEEVVGTFKGHLQQISAELAQNLGLNFTKSFQVWCPPNTDVQVGDGVECNDIFYTVRAIQDNSFVGSNKHLQVFIEKNEHGS